MNDKRWLFLCFANGKHDNCQNVLLFNSKVLLVGSYGVPIFFYSFIVVLYISTTCSLLDPPLFEVNQNDIKCQENKAAT